jgi:hypothetical protein
MLPNGWLTRGTTLGWLACLATGAAQAATDDPPLPAPAAAFVERTLPGGLDGTPRDGRALFEQVLAGPAFVRGTAGPFDVHVLVGDALGTEREARKLLDAVLEALQPAAGLVAERWPEGGDGLISGARLPVVLVDPGQGGASYQQLLALLDHCERLGYSGWAPANAVDTAQNRAAEVTRTWEVQVYDLSHASIAGRRKQWIERGVGYYALAFVGNRALHQGAWGLVPPWLAHGLIDELDIAAYGEAWVGQESWTEQTPGWYRAGWSGFVPQGARPPAPITGPPADLAVSVVKTGDPWLGFEASRTRHWKDLAADGKSEAPASFERAAETESFLPRDRAAARCLLALMHAVAPAEAGSLTSLLDRPVHTPGDGMPDSDPLPVLFARALGGVPEVDRLESQSARALLVELGRADLIERVEDLSADALLELSDHREQSRWLYGQPRFTREARGDVFQAILEIEYCQQMAEWRVISPRLDGALAAALAAGKTYPARDRDVAKVEQAFRAGLLAEPAARDDESAKGRRKGSSRSRR